MPAMYPISYLDPTGLGVEGWYLDDYGQMQFNNNIHSQGDMDIFGISGTYQFEDGFWAGKDGFQSYYGADGGDPVPIVGALETVNLMGKKEDNSNSLASVLTSLDKHFNGGLGLVSVSVKTYSDVIPNHTKRHYAHKISKKTGIKSGKIYQETSSFFKKTAKYAKPLGVAGTLLSVGTISYDLIDDGYLNSSSIVNGALIGIGISFPVTAPFILSYGILDYALDISEGIDKKLGEVKVYEKNGR